MPYYVRMGTLRTRTKILRIGYKEDNCVQEVELTFQCPVCLAIETLFIENGTLAPSRHWKYFRGRVYHRDCARPARLIDMSRRKLFVPANTSESLLCILKQRQETIGQFAVNIGVSRMTVKRWLLGKCRPNGTSRRRISRYTKMPGSLI